MKYCMKMHHLMKIFQDETDIIFHLRAYDTRSVLLRNVSPNAMFRTLDRQLRFSTKTQQMYPEWGSIACIHISYLQATLSRVDRDFAGAGQAENDQHPDTGGFSRISPALCH